MVLFVGPRDPPMPLILRHVPASDPAKFQVEFGGVVAPAVEVMPPSRVKVAGGVHLLTELTWYLEQFLDYPFPPETERAERLQRALKQWGQDAFQALFETRDGIRAFDAAKSDGYDKLQLQVVSDAPEVLDWPWEALHDPRAGWLVLTAPIERRLATPGEPAPLAASLPRDRVNVLLVIARPYEQDVKFRSVARPLVELAETENLPVEIHVLRPPTLENLKRHLQERTGYYHILHFDGHGSYHADNVASGGGYTLHGPQGRLIFETDDGNPEPVEGRKLVELLREYGILVAVLNACQSGMILRTDDPFASVAASLLKAGLRSVVAMSHVVYVSAAQQFLPAFYQRLFQAGSIPQAVRAGRQQLRDRPERVCARGSYPLDDWLVPVLYQQAELPLDFVSTARKTERSRTQLPEQARDERNPYGFIGRDGALLALERGLRGKAAAVLVTGLGGVGKTTLVKGFLRWLEQTDGLEAAPLWFSFEGLRNTEYLLNRLGEAVFGNPAFAILDGPKKVQDLARTLKGVRWLIVWDNFESAQGVPGSTRPGLLSAADCTLLKDFLSQLRGGKTKVLITSRSTEDWLEATNRGKPIALGGLDGEERWQYANGILADLGIKPDRKSPELAKLMDQLQGHPLAMRVMLTKLDRHTPEQLVEALTKNVTALQGVAKDEDEARLFATLRFVTNELPAEWQVLIYPLSLHARFVDGEYLEHMAKRVAPGCTRATIDAFLNGLTTAGLLQDFGNAVFGMHPLLNGYLGAVRGTLDSQPDGEAWIGAFVVAMSDLAEALRRQLLHQKRVPFLRHEENFQHARDKAKELQIPKEFAVLTYGLARFALLSRDWDIAERLSKELLANQQQRGKDAGAAEALYLLGCVYKERRNFEAAEQWFRKALEVNERLGDKHWHSVADTYYQLGMVAQERQDFESSERWYGKALELRERQRDEYCAAGTYNQLGMVAQERQNFEVAEQWYRKALEINERLGNEEWLSINYEQLGSLADDRADLEAAEQWHRKALEINERLGDEHLAAGTYHNLGNVAFQRGDFDAAERLYYRALEINERLNNKHWASINYTNLGRVCEERRDFKVAEQWYRKALAIQEWLGNEHGAASTCFDLGMMAQKQGDLASAEQWYRKLLAIKQRLGDEHEAAKTLGQLGELALARDDARQAAQWFLQAIRKFIQVKDPDYLFKAAGDLLQAYRQLPEADRAPYEMEWKQMPELPPLEELLAEPPPKA
jgi:tetratricopeptide (TPR) repeat protein